MGSTSGTKTRGGEGFFFRTFSRGKKCEVGSVLRVGTECGLYYFIPSGSSCGHLGRWRRRLDPHRHRARAVLEEVAVRTLAVVPAVGYDTEGSTNFMGAQHGRASSSPGCREARVVLTGMLLLVYPLTQWRGAAAGAGCARLPL